MNLNNRYLSDEELNALICEIEQDDLIMAPPELKVKVLHRAVDKKREFAGYCFRVITSVAAAIVMLVLLPKGEAISNFEMKIPSREEVLKTQEYVSKEEALNKKSYVKKMIENIAIRIGNDNVFSVIVMNENGGE